MSCRGLTRWELTLSLLGPFVFLAVAANIGGVVSVVFLVVVLGGLGIAAAAFGVDSRDGLDWRDGRDWRDR